MKCNLVNNNFQSDYVNNLLKSRGVTNIEISTDCTACAPNRFWSHRITGGQRGAQVGVIVCKGE